VQNTAVSLVELLINQDRADEALTWASRFTTFELADYSRLIGQELSDPEAQKAFEQWQQKNQQLSGIRRQLEEEGYPETLVQRMRSLEEEVYSEAERLIDAYPELAEFLETTPEDIARLQATIPEGTLAIQPVLLDNSIALFLLGRDRAVTVKEISIDSQEFNTLLEDYREQLIKTPKNSDSEKLAAGQEQLYELLIRPIEEEIAAANPTQLSFILTGKLRSIPVETLYDTETQQYLLQKYPIHYRTRLSSRQPASNRATPNTPKVLAFGNPIPLPPHHLEYAALEAEEIAALFPDSEAYTENEATLEQFKLLAPRFPYLHLATHGCFEPDGCQNLDLEANTILFADQSYHIADAALLGLTNTELIVLSACQTAQEAFASGQEIAGLAYIFERAGAEAVIASLWNAEDKTTREIMVEFYRQLQQGKSKSEALRQAKLSYIKNFDHPFIWSHLVLIGDGE
jgi:CHAT domain-containing protein